ncbi:carcinoembryonic antigen-related cell adhesion molecule 6-like isoform X1 [Panthera uncia]|uniref:carcinoembryonic antigen-related cell adhesion molecule 6-like isoform X1 n=1 Tax=Panthera uncia TaxID=29064 RepID=UPI0020FFD004|nr:carcinoembryonic antigen-related cell adhesion molecule 6-like isoform X1 [Panthera uncia]
MEPPSALPRGGRVPWQELLLAVSLLTFWNPPTTAQVTVELVPPNAAEGKDVLLRVHNLTANLLGFGWFKGTTINPRREIVSYAADSQEITPGLAHSGRETLYHNGSLLFQNINLEDTGYYTLQIIKRNVQVERVTGQLRVYPELPKPNITSNNSDPVENVDSVVLTCEPQTQNTSYLWSVNSKSLPDSARLELSLDNRTLTLHGVTRNDTGPYECETWNPVSASRSDPFTLNVLYGPDVPTISPSDSYYCPGANLSLSCHSASNPPAQYSWLINGSPQPSSQELFIPNITVNDNGSYACLVYNPGTRLNKFTVKTITVSDGRSPTGLPVGTSVGIAIGVLVGGALVAALGYLLLRVKAGRASGQRNHREMGHPACTPGHGPVSSSTSPNTLPSPRTAVPIYQELQHPDRNIYCQINHKGQVSS